MCKTFHKLIAAALFTALAVGTVVTAQAKPKKGVEKDTGIKGKITAVDAAAKTITVANKTVFIDSTTEIFRSGKLIALNAVRVGSDAQVNTVLLADKLTATSVRLGAPAAAGTEPKQEPKK